MLINGDVEVLGYFSIVEVCTHRVGLFIFQMMEESALLNLYLPFAVLIRHHLLYTNFYAKKTATAGSSINTLLSVDPQVYDRLSCILINLLCLNLIKRFFQFYILDQATLIAIRFLGNTTCFR